MPDALALEPSEVPAPDVPRVRQELHPVLAWAKAYYEPQKKRGKVHNAAIRSPAFKWIRVIRRCWKDRKPHDKALYLQTRKQRGSELANLIARQPQEA